MTTVFGNKFVKSESHPVSVVGIVVVDIPIVVPIGEVIDIARIWRTKPLIVAETLAE